MCVTMRVRVIMLMAGIGTSMVVAVMFMLVLMIMPMARIGASQIVAVMLMLMLVLMLMRVSMDVFVIMIMRGISASFRRAFLFGMCVVFVNRLY
mmetsp:Transcript_119379/g.234558  ORF Transcript_119379/g.234558 Transcript_119379/m.234558 type:complete len:94 (-) Transcript_119379:1005-1286(-)